jgi:hypothetical protein
MTDKNVEAEMKNNFLIMAGLDKSNDDKEYNHHELC